MQNNISNISIKNKIPVGILGATGIVGQNYIRLLENHPWFDVQFVSASPNSAGKTYSQAVDGKWQMLTPIPDSVKNLIVADANIVDSVIGQCKLVFSCFEISDKKAIQDLEFGYAKAGIVVVSNASAHRWTDDVPMLLPEINSSHLDILELQKTNHNLTDGFVVVKPNCSIQSYLTPIYALMEAGFEVKKLIVNTLQAVSGAGYPGVSSMDMIDNIVPYIGGEEEKTENEPLKILGSIVNNQFSNFNDLVISAHCNRVPVIDGHTATISMLFGDKKPTEQEIIDIWTNFRSVPQDLALPFAPVHPIAYTQESNRPQPRKDRDTDKGMRCTIGRLRVCPVFDYKFVALSHNTVRGAAGGGILNAELLVAKGLVG